MNISMRVHTVAVAPVEVDVHYDGEKARALMPQLAVELMSVDGKHGTWTAHFRSAAEMAEAKELFHPGDLVTVTITPAAPAAISTEAEATA